MCTSIDVMFIKIENMPSRIAPEAFLIASSASLLVGLPEVIRLWARGVPVIKDFNIRQLLPQTRSELWNSFVS